MKIYINGRFLTQRITGVQRYALEITKAMDELIGQNEKLQKNEYVLIAPDNILYRPELRNISIIVKGFFHGHIWEQFELPIYTRDGFLFNFCNCAPILKRNQTVTIHDAAIAVMPQTFSWYFRTWYNLMFKVLGKNLEQIFTVSNFSRKELHKYFGIQMSKIAITYNGIDHIRNITPDTSILDRFHIGDKKYALAVSSLNPSKNFRLVLDVAAKMPDILFIIAGGNNSKVFNSIGLETPPNAKFIGYVFDEELIALYQKASVFLYPSLYEGFGIPPLEALSCGCQAVVSDIDVFHEIYGDLVKYSDTKSQEAWIDCIHVIFYKKCGNDLANKEYKKTYNWKISAKTLLSHLIRDC